MEEEDGEKELSELQKEIDAQLEKDSARRKKESLATVINTPGSLVHDDSRSEDSDASRFAAEDTLNIIGEITKDMKPKNEAAQKSDKLKLEKGLGPDLATICLSQPEDKQADKFLKPEPKPQFSKDLHTADELLLSQKDEEYISSLIMSEQEALHKSRMWNKINATYLKEQKAKEELRAKEREENKQKRKVRGSYKKKVALNAATAGEAIEKMLAERRISSKINYDILKSLDQPGTPLPPATPSNDTAKNVTVEAKAPTPSVSATPASPAVPRKRKKKNTAAAPTATSTAPALPTTPVPKPTATPKQTTPAPSTPAPATPNTEHIDDYDDEIEAEVDASAELSLAAMLQNGQDDDYYDYEEY